MNTEELISNLRITKLKLASERLKLKRKNRALHDRYIYLSLLLAQQKLDTRQTDDVKLILQEVIENMPVKVKNVSEVQPLQKAAKNSFLQPNDSFGKMLPGVE